MKQQPPHNQLSRRESQIMDVIYAQGEATARQIEENLADAPSNSAIRTHLRILEDKGFLSHHKEGNRYVYKPTVQPETARRSLLDHLVRTFFGGSTPKTIAALLDTADLSAEDLDELDQLIDKARREERKDD